MSVTHATSSVLSLIPSIGTWDLILLGIKVFLLLYIVRWVRRRLTNSTAMTVIILVLGYLLLFRWSGFWIPVLVFLLALSHGVLELAFDLAIGKPWKKSEMGEGEKKKAAEKRKGERKKKSREEIMKK